MRIALTVLALSVASLVAVAGELAPKELARIASADSKRLDELLRSNWIISSSLDTITLESKFYVYRVALFGRRTALPEFSDSAVLTGESKRERYVIRLRYSNALSKAELEARRKERQKAADTLNFGAEGKATYEEAAKRYMEVQVPHYGGALHQIYRDLPETPYAKIYPPSAVKEIGAAKEILATVLSRLRTAHD